MQLHARIYKQKINKIYFLKNEIKKILLKSIILDKSITPIYRTYAYYIFTKKKKKESIATWKNVCLILSKHRSVYTKFNIKRHTLKKFNSFAIIPNLKSTGW